MALTDFIRGRTNRIILGSTAGVGLIVATLVSIWGNPLPAFRVENPEGERMWEVSDHGAMGVGTGANAWGTAGQALTSGGGSGKLMSWATISGGGGGTTNTGGLMLIFDNRYVNTLGDTMTGNLLISQANLTASGARIDGAITLNGVTYTFPYGDGSASGKVLKTNSAGQLSWSTDNDSAAAGINAVTAEGMFVNQGGDSMTGSLTNTKSVIARNLAASTLQSCDTIDSTSTGMLVCGTDLNGLTWGQIQTLADPQYVNVGGDTMTGALKVRGALSGATLQINALSACTNLQTNVAGLLACNTSDYLLQTEADTESELETLLTDVTNVYTDNDTVPVADGGTGFASCTDGGFITGNDTNALTCNGILTDNQIYIGDGTTEPTATAIPVCTAVQKIQYTDAGNTLTCVTDTNTTYSVGQGLTLTSTVIKLSAAHSGSVIQASATLASSGTLVVEGVTTLNGATTVNASLSGSSLYISGMPRMRRIVVIPLCDGATACAVGSGSTFRIPNMLADYTLSGATLDASIPGVTGTMSVNVFNQGGNCYLFSTAITLDTTEQSSDTAATGYAKTAGCKVFSSGQRLVPQITAVHSGSAAKGVSLTLDLIP